MSERYGINNTHLKNRNRGLVLQIVAGGHVSRAGITKRIKLTKMTVTNIVNELIADGYIEETETEETETVGRNPVILGIAPKAPLAVGVYLSRTQLSVIVSDLKLQVVYQNSQPLENETRDTLIKKLFDLTDQAIEYVKGQKLNSRLLGIGVSAIGQLDSKTGMILRPTNFFGITDLPIVNLISGRYSLPTFLKNDMDASALAEKFFGQGAPLTNFIYLGITHGIGSGIISNNTLYQDSSSFVGEIGHMSIKFDGAYCSCGKCGCLEVYANIPVILDRLREASGNSELRCQDFDQISAAPECDGIFRDVIQKLAVALVNAVNLLDPACIIMGHEGAFIPLPYLGLLEKLVNHQILATGYKKITVIKSSFEDRAPLFGSVSCVFNELFAGNLY